MRMHKNILGGGHLLGANSRVARRHRCAGVGRPQISATAPRVVVAGASLALVLLAGALLFPPTPDAAQAEEATEASPRTTTSVGLTVPATIEFADVMATPSGATTTASAKINVTTTASAGYKLYLYAKDNSLKSLNPNTTQSIASASASSLDNFTNNTWGYNLTEGPTAGTTYSALPTTNTTPTQTKDTSTTNSANDTYTLSLGAKVDSTIPSGTYTSIITISVVAEPAILAFEGIETMQEMTSIICSNADEGETARLKDTRDGKLYWVTKLKDGNCWMTQNLDFDIPADGITNENGLAAKTDLPDGTVWDSSSDYSPQPTTTGSPFSSSTNTDTYSFDPGLYVNDPSKGWTTCNTYYEDTSTCTAGNWTKIADSMSPMTTERTDGTVVDGNTYDAHYLVGNYYQFNTATAGTGASVTSNGDDAPSSICPKGWKLPTSGNSDLGSFAYLIIGVNSNYIIKAPLYFIPAGYVYLGSLHNAGNIGLCWSSTAVSSPLAYYLYFDSSAVNPSNRGSFRYGGQSVRCLAR